MKRDEPIQIECLGAGGAARPRQRDFLAMLVIEWVPMWIDH